MAKPASVKKVAEQRAQFIQQRGSRVGVADMRKRIKDQTCIVLDFASRDEFNLGPDQYLERKEMPPGRPIPDVDRQPGTVSPEESERLRVLCARLDPGTGLVRDGEVEC